MTVLLPNNQKPVVDASGKPTAPFSRWMRDVSAGSSSTADASVEELPDSGIGSAMVKLTRDAYGRIAGMQPATTTDLIEGGSLYFTDERAQDAVGAAILDSASIALTYDDTANTITGVVKPTTVVAGSYGNSTNVSTFTVAADGRLTLAGTAAIPNVVAAGAAGFMIGADKTKLDGVASGATAYTDARAQEAVVIDSIADADTTHAPSRNAVFDALALKADLATGSFTPTVAGMTIAGTGTYTTQLGKYTKIGNVVTFKVFVWITAHTGTGNLIIAGLPFASANDGLDCAVSLGYVDNIALTAGNAATATVVANSTYIRLLQAPASGGTVITVPMDTEFILQMAGSYFTS